MTTIGVIQENRLVLEVITNPVPINGADGKSAYEVALENGFIGTEQEWLDSFLQRANHLGIQDISTIDNLQNELDSKVNNSDIGVTVQPYDSNLVTFSQTEKDKLETIQEGAEVNVNADWDAVIGDAFILNKPSLGSIASRDSDEFATFLQGLKADSAVQPNQIANFETSTQLNTRDTANRDRTNHKGSQPISTISGLQTALDGKQPTGDYATNTALNTKEPVIITGTTGQYWRGDKSWQTLDKTAVGLSNVDNTSDSDKIISTATQSALDLKAPLDSPSFTGKLVLPNNSRINGIEHFYQTTKPITRGDGSALVIGDRWWKTDEGTEWFWNGSYWARKKTFVSESINANQSNSFDLGQIDFTGSIIITKIKYLVKIPYNNSSNYWRIDISLNTLNYKSETISSINTQNTAENTLITLSEDTYLIFNNYLGTDYGYFLKASLSKIGTPDNLDLSISVDYLEVFESIPTFLGFNLTPNFWIDTVNGSDLNNGTSEETAFASLNKINSIVLNANQTVVVRVKSGNYNKPNKDYVENSTAGSNAHLIIVFEPNCIMNGNSLGYNGFEFAEINNNTWKTTIYGNGLNLINYSEGTSLSPNGIGNRNYHILYAYNVHANNCDDGFSSHQNARMYLYDCSAKNCEKGETVHVDNAYVEHHRCEFSINGPNVVGAGSPTIKFFDCKIIPTPSGQTLIGGFYFNCQIGTLSVACQLTGTLNITNSFINAYVDGTDTAIINKCFGKLTLRVRAPMRSIITNCIITGCASGYSSIIFSNFNSGANSTLTFKNNIVSFNNFIAVDLTNANYLINGNSIFSYNLLANGAVFDSDLTGSSILVNNTSVQNALIGAGNTLSAFDYGYRENSPAIGIGENGTNCGFAVGDVKQRVPMQQFY